MIIEALTATEAPDLQNAPDKPESRQTLCAPPSLFNATKIILQSRHASVAVCGLTTNKLLKV